MSSDGFHLGSLPVPVQVRQVDLDQTAQQSPGLGTKPSKTNTGV